MGVRIGAGLIGLCVLGALTLAAPARENHSRELAFEGADAAAALGAWNRFPKGAEGTMSLDSTVVHEGRYAGRIDRAPGSPGGFSAFGRIVVVDFPGDSLELRGWLKWEQVEGSIGLWQRQDGAERGVQFDNMEGRKLAGTAGWTEFRVVLPLDRRAQRVAIGAILIGQGRLWADDLRVYVDGKPLADVPEIVRAPTAIETDTEFDAGSKVEVTSVNAVQTANLVLLGRVWGFVKYHHPAIIAGKRHWDYDLFRVLPPLLAARDRAGAQQVLAEWVAGLGEAPPCSVCVELPPDRVVPRLAWLADRKLLGGDLSARLVAIHARRPQTDTQFFAGKVAGVGNPDFHNEGAYPALREPDTGYRLLALFRFWNIIEYWFPYRDLIEEDWTGVLREFVPRVVAARGRDAYAATMMAVIARVHDTHANLWSSLDVRPPRGKFDVPVAVRFVENEAVVWTFRHPTLGAASGLQVGDEIRAVDGVPVRKLVERWRPMYAASNEPTRLRDIGRALLRGDSTSVRLAVRRAGATLDLEVPRMPADSIRLATSTHDRPGPAFRRLSAELAYLKLSNVRAADTDDYLEGAAGVRGLVIDIRNYPSEFMVFAFGQHLVAEPTPFVRFSIGDPANPGSFYFTDPLPLQPAAPHFEGAVAILVDEVSQSQAEYTTMAFRARPGAVVVGSTTAGADGNVSPIPLPGGLRTLISGIGVFYPDRRPTQRVGIVPDLEVHPTIAGIRAGRDEVLEAAVRRMLGRDMTAAEHAALSAGAPAAP